MAHQRLQHYLRTYRRRFGLSQDEIAVLLGASSGTKVSRYENYKRNPSVVTIFAFEIIFNLPVRTIFAGNYDAVRRQVRARATRLAGLLASKPLDTRTTRKLALLNAIVESNPHPPGHARS